MSSPISNLPSVPPADKTVTVLAVSPHREDHARLQAIFSHSNWRIYGVHTCEEAIGFLRSHQIAVVVCESTLRDGDWKVLLEKLLPQTMPPMLVVTSKRADDSLWAEVLNLGAYDVLPKPLDRVEVMRVVSLAWLHWKDRFFQERRTPSGSVPVKQNSVSAVA